MQLLALLFFVTALVYSSVGFGGGSTYTALLVLFDIDYRSIPVISLCCNIIVVTTGAIHFYKNKLLDKGLILALVTFSIPMSFIGGRLPVPEQLFVLILGITLLIASILLLINRKDFVSPKAEVSYWRLGLVLGTPIGLVAGITGIGGGIFLAPILHLLRIARPRLIAATACIFILLNSLAGLSGQLLKQGYTLWENTLQLRAIALLPLAVLIGGFIGNRIALKYFTPVQLRRMTAILVLIVAIRLLHRYISY